jgi:hypothetical protein
MVYLLVSAVSACSYRGAPTFVTPLAGARKDAAHDNMILADYGWFHAHSHPTLLCTPAMEQGRCTSQERADAQPETLWRSDRSTAKHLTPGGAPYIEESFHAVRTSLAL